MSLLKRTCALVLVSSALLSSCATTSYIGDILSPTTSVDVFYSAGDIKVPYKVIGHISAATGTNENKAKDNIIVKAKSVGADGVIILGLGFTGGKDSAPYEKADAIKYLK